MERTISSLVGKLSRSSAKLKDLSSVRSAPMILTNTLKSTFFGFA